MISHDRFFIDRLADRVLEVDDGRIHEYLGNYSEYLEKKAQLTTPPPRTPEPPRPPAAPPVPEETKRRGVQYRQRQQQEIEARIAALETQKAEMETLLASPELYADGLRAVEVTNAHQQLQHDLAAVYAEWEAVAEDLLTLEMEAENVRQERLKKG